ncbi:hypothetical protein [Streptomyces sp. NPDC017993]|uniref:hypothetical protein n=1 Tax=Streptomyces sp. NPDC017993 TaxID=3365027 RepID=UPI0037BCB0FF
MEERTQEAPKKSRGETVADNIGASPAIFIFLAFLGFFLAETQEGEHKAWYMYFAGWVASIVMLAKAAITRKGPEMGTLVGVVLLVIFGLLISFTHRDSFPF